MAPPPRPGETFIQENPKWFTGCNCKREVAAIMNRWTEKEQATDTALNTISRTISNKTHGVDLLTIQARLREFIERWFDGKG